MAAYLIVRIDVTDAGKFAAYREAVPAVIARFGGRYLVRGGPVEVLEGGHDGRRQVVLEFPSMEALHRFWASREYAEVKALREGAGELDILAVPGA